MLDPELTKLFAGFALILALMLGAIAITPAIVRGIHVEVLP